MEQALDDLETFKAAIVKLRDQLQAKQTELHELTGPTPEERYNERRKKQRATAQDAVQRAMSVEI